MSTRILYEYRRFPQFPHPIAVGVEEIEMPEMVHLYHGTLGVEDFEDEPPRTYTTITPNEARELGEALIRAADLIGEILTGRCETCAGPVAAEVTECNLCSLRRHDAERRERRSKLHAVI